jgi:hypothetical protein
MIKKIRILLKKSNAKMKKDQSLCDQKSFIHVGEDVVEKGFFQNGNQSIEEKLGIDQLNETEE